LFELPSSPDATVSDDKGGCPFDLRLSTKIFFEDVNTHNRHIYRVVLSINGGRREGRQGAAASIQRHRKASVLASECRYQVILPGKGRLRTPGVSSQVDIARSGRCPAFGRSRLQIIRATSGILRNRTVSARLPESVPMNTIAARQLFAGVPRLVRKEVERASWRAVRVVIPPKQRQGAQCRCDLAGVAAGAGAVCAAGVTSGVGVT
jgi:hypothetical protein